MRGLTQLFVATAFAAGAVLPLCASQVAADDAVLAARGWAASGAALGGAPSGEASLAKSYPAFHVVAFSGGGYVVLSADTDLRPVIAWANDGEWVDDEAQNPQLAMLGGTNATAASSASLPAEKIAANSAKWAKFIAAGVKLAAPGGKTLLSSAVTQVSATTDLRVDELLETRWYQYGAGTNYCYNYYTPLHRACGCVATMAAQIMRYHKWPTGEVTFGKTNRRGDNRWSYGGIVQFDDGNGGTTNGCWEVWANSLLDENGCYYSGGYNINGYQSTLEEAQAGKRKSDYVVWEPAFGGTYDWDKMPASPTSDTSDEECREIGRICRDAGLAAWMNYETGGSGATLMRLSNSFVDTFQYADCHYKESLTADDIYNGILANLDAKLPVGVAVPHHAIIADGYGYVDGDLYIHFNMGFGGGGSWYMPPIVYEDAAIASTRYDSIDNILYNIYTPEHGEEGCSIVSGRVLDANGSPVAGLSVRCDGGDAVATTDSNGIYALFVEPGEHSIAVASGTTVAHTNLTVEACISPYVYNDRAYSNKLGTPQIGNIWGVELQLAEASETALGWINETADTAGETGSWDVTMEYDSSTKEATIDEEATFTPLTESNGRYATVTSVVGLDLPDGDIGEPDDGAQAAVRRGPSGGFQVWTAGAWLDVANASLDVSTDAEYTVAIKIDYTNSTYSVVVDGCTLASGSQTSFALATNAAAVSAVAYKGYGSFLSLAGTYYSAEGFSEYGEVVLAGATNILSAAQAAWLNGLGDYATVSAKAATLTADAFGNAYLLNLDFTSDDYDGTYTFELTSMEVSTTAVAIGVRLIRNGAAAQAINGVLRVYGSTDLDDWAVVSGATIGDSDFSEGDETTATLSIGDDTRSFYKVKVEEE